jgi:hypothetical protein
MQKDFDIIKLEDLETVIVRNKVHKTLFDVVEIDSDGDIANCIARSVTFEEAQNIVEKQAEA